MRVLPTVVGAEQRQIVDCMFLNLGIFLNVIEMKDRHAANHATESALLPDLSLHRF